MREVFATLDELQLLASETRVHHILSLPRSDIASLLDQIETSGSAFSGPPASSEMWLPFADPSVLRRLPTYALIFERTLIVDPLYDAFAALELSETESEATNILRSAYTDLGLSEPSTFDVPTKEDMEAYRAAAALRLSEVIDGYISNRELLLSGAIVPCHTGAIYSRTDVLHGAVAILTKMLPPSLMSAVRSGTAGTKDVAKAFGAVLSDREARTTFFDVMAFILTASQLKRIVTRGANLDLGPSSNRRAIDLILQSGLSALTTELNNVGGVQWPIADNEVIIPAVDGVHGSDVADLRAAEPAALAHFRYDTHKLLGNLRRITEPEEYTELVRQYEDEQRIRALDVQRLAETIRRDHVRRVSQHIGVALFSAAASSLTAFGNGHDAAQLVALAAGSAGVIASVAGLLQTWVSHGSAIDSLGAQPGYIVWRLRHRQPRA